ncbi:agmatinase [Halodesulfurarchaeum sp. HSR-GB]|uniref:agmatinase n=1 Tax=Halodesulfurarchaeum sp. HSR-GB TaxID=3074077 RepID=UPI002855818F|nr:agmatinase [Halodesulfurarchaeum sp. HSR-GB]MDR5655760.1 agmatinase [Halodesulfurarchaeum sp. HSR-GB]
MFPGANAAREDADFVIAGAPLDVSTSFQPGTRFGPDRIRRFARSFEDYDHHTGSRFTDLAVHDHGDVEAWDDARDYLDYLSGVLADACREDAVPLLLGGEHTVTVAGVEAVDPDVFVTLDAHLDLRESYAGNEWSHATVTRHALDVADRAVILGARAGSEAEWERATAGDVTVVPPAAVGDWNPDFDEESVYLSVDIDAADPAYAPGTGTMEPFGLSSRELRAVVRQVAPAMDGFDVVEVNDQDDGQSATLAAKLLRTAVFARAAGETPGSL